MTFLHMMQGPVSPLTWCDMIDTQLIAIMRLSMFHQVGFLTICLVSAIALQPQTATDWLLVILSGLATVFLFEKSGANPYIGLIAVGVVSAYFIGRKVSLAKLRCIAPIVLCLSGALFIPFGIGMVSRVAKSDYPEFNHSDSFQLERVLAQIDQNIRPDLHDLARQLREFHQREQQRRND